MKLNIIYTSVATTRSGKMIPYTTTSVDLGSIVQHFRDSSFSPDDLLDAFAVFDYLAVHAIRRNDIEIFDLHSDKTQDLLGPRELNDARLRANIRSAFDLRALGKSLASVEFADQ